ncbi:MAG: glycosyltransferase family 2 protein, partial [bacterium]|nr:glycosyltransferase family 2 protein [bacterium]
MYDLSILIPARNEMFLAKTVEDILANIEGNTEIIVVEDGGWSTPGVPQNERVTLIYHPVSVGQRAATNEAAKLSTAKYLMKCDAHCTFDKGFDTKMMVAMHDDWTMVPVMRNLHAFDWVCPDGHRRYQGPSGPCKECGKETTRDILWKAKNSPNSVSYCFDSTPHFQYFGDFAKRPEARGEITETMSLQGSCWLLTREKYWELNVCDENFGSWGSQGIEVALKTWLSGGRVMCNHRTWYAHMFRTQGGDFGFPYPMSGKDQEHAKSYARDLFFNNKWPQQTQPLSWLVEKFWPVKGWTEEDLVKLKANTFKFSEKDVDTKSAESEPVDEKLTQGVIYDSSLSLSTRPAVNLPIGNEPSKGIIYYTDNQLDLKIAHAVQERLKQISETKHLPITSCSLKKMSFGVKNVHFPSLKRGYLTMFKQILAGLEHSKAEVVFFCEHDVLYQPSHFDFTPPDKDKFYYNENVWKVDPQTGLALHYDCKQVSGICVYRETALKHYSKRVEMVQRNGFSMKMGFEPGTHHRTERVDDLTSGSWKSPFPNIDIRHGHNL